MGRYRGKERDSVSFQASSTKGKRKGAGPGQTNEKERVSIIKERTRKKKT